MRETGITSLSESLKINTSLLKLFLRGLHTNQMRTGYQSTNHLWIPKHTGNSIGTKSAESMREALETNTTLTELHLDCENEINRRLIHFKQVTLPFSSHWQGAGLPQRDLYYWEKHLRQIGQSIHLIWVVNTWQISWDSICFHLSYVYSTVTRYGDEVKSLSEALKVNTTLTTVNLASWKEKRIISITFKRLPIVFILITPQTTLSGMTGQQH